MAELIDKGQLEIITITEDLHEQVIQFYKENFLKYENLCNVCEILQNEEAITESAHRIRNLLQYGLSFAIRQNETGNLVAICINKFLPSPACLVRLDESLACLNNAFDILKEWNIDCALEICYLVTRHDFSGYGLATILAKYAVNIAHQMLEGTLTNDKVVLPSHIKELKPKAVLSLFTSKYTQKIGEKLGMKTQFQVGYADLFYNDKSFAEKLEPIHKSVTIAALKF